MNKKANLLGAYTLKVIIAVISLLLLIYLLVSLYASFSNEKNFTNAKATLKNLDEKMIDARKLGVKQTLPLSEPNGWKLISYLSTDKPEQCIDNCICLCEDEETGKYERAWIWAHDQVEKCEVRGVCENYKEKLNAFNVTLRSDVEIEFKSGAYIINKAKKGDENE